MKIYRCKMALIVPVMDKLGRIRQGGVTIAEGMVFTAEDEGQRKPGGAVKLDGVQGLRLQLSREKLTEYFEELA